MATATGSPGGIFILLRKVSISWRFYALISLFMVFICGAILTLQMGIDGIIQDNTDTAKKILLRGQKQKIAVASQSVAMTLGQALQDVPDKNKRIALIRTLIDPIRFEEDKSGYYFVYEKTVNVALPTLKDRQGKDLAGLTDVHGVHYVKELEHKAESGGGFVEYVFPKPGQGDQPKLAYATMIPGTDMWIGTGIYIDNVERESSALHEASHKRITTLLTGLYTGIGIGLLVLIGLCLLLISTITGPIRQATDAAIRCAAGDLDVNLHVVGNDEAARMQGALNTMVSTLRANMEAIKTKTQDAEEKAQAAEEARQMAEMATSMAEQAKAEGLLQAAGRLGGVVGVVSQVSDGLSGHIEDSSQGAREQAQRIAETATAMEEMNATVLEVARNASAAAGTTDSARLKAGDGATVVGRMIESVGRVREQATTLKENMGQLGGQVQDIGRIMNVISDIADQTNLLALNAAIEAARAGEAGRGFAVVADEVRKLAEKTMHATKEVGEAISTIQRGTGKNVDSAVQAAATTQEASDLATAAGTALTEIVHLVEAASDQVRSIATAAEQQSSTSEEINRSVEAINSISTTTSQAMDEAAKAVAKLTSQTRELEALMASLEADGKDAGHAKVLG